MIRMASTLAIGMLLAAIPASAQYSDIGGANLDAAGSIAGTMAMNSYLDDDDDNRPARSSRRARSRAAATCANLPKVRARYGANNPNVQGLARACRQGGYL